MKRNLMRDLPHFYVVGDRVFTIPGGISLQRPFDESELGERAARWLESEWMGWSAVDEVTCAACRHSISQGAALRVCDACRVPLLERMREIAKEVGP